MRACPFHLDRASGGHPGKDKKIHLLFVEKWESIGEHGWMLIKCVMDLTLIAISHNICLRKRYLFHGFLLEIVLDSVQYIPPPMLEATGVNWAETGQMEKKEQV